MDMIDGLLNRHSTRQYDATQKASPDEIETILRCACQAPSAMNQQDWAFMVVNEKGLLEELQNTLMYAGFLQAAGTAIVVTANPDSAFEEYWRVDALLAGQNILLAAEGLGLGACWCGIYPNTEKMQLISEILGIPEPHQVMCIIAVGRPAEAALNTAVLPRYNKEKVHYNKW